jgi:hypothetical protein
VTSGSTLRFYALFGCTVLAACSSVRPRCSPVLGETHGLVLSNSPMFVEKHEPTMRDGQLEADYSLLVQNLGTDAFVFQLTEASAVVEKERVAVSCGVRTVKEKGQAFVLRPDTRARIECVMRLSPEATRLVARGDRRLELSLPVHATSGSGTLTLSYALRMEDVR